MSTGEWIIAIAIIVVYLFFHLGVGPEIAKQTGTNPIPDPLSCLGGCLGLGFSIGVIIIVIIAMFKSC
jgi:hypothetical protein